MSIESDIPSFIGTSPSHIHDEDVSHIHDEDLSHIHDEDLSVDSEESSSRFSFFKRISQNEGIKSPRFVQGLKRIASKKFIKNTTTTIENDDYYDTPKDPKGGEDLAISKNVSAEEENNKETTNNKVYCYNTIEADAITEASSNPSADNDEKSLVTLTLTRKLSESTSAEEVAQPILESIPGDPTADLQVGFPSDNNHGKRGLLPTVKKFRKSMRGNMLRLKSERSLKCIDERKDDSDKCQEEEGRDETEAQHNGRATPTKEECIALEKELIEAKLALVLVREELERNNTLMNRTIKERDWLRTQYSTLQFEHHAMKEQMKSK